MLDRYGNDIHADVDGEEPVSSGKVSALVMVVTETSGE
jgi:hypothetical protein